MVPTHTSLARAWTRISVTAQSVSRRHFLGGLSMGSMAMLAPSLPSRPLRSAPRLGSDLEPFTVPTGGKFTVPPLGYAYDALEPHIDAFTMVLHHDRHHAAYVTQLNAALANYPELQNRDATDLISTLDTLPEAIRTAVRNNGGGHVNHSIFWAIMTPGGGGAPTGALAQAIDTTFGSLDALKRQVNDAGVRRFGSGWTWLVVDGAGTLQVMSTPNQDSPYMLGMTPLLGNDVWEHAYYLTYQNRRADYLTAWWNTVNWPAVAQRYAAARGQ